MRIIILGLVFLFQCNSEPINKDQLIECLTRNNSANQRQINGKFSYYESDQIKGSYKSVFVSDSHYKLHYNFNSSDTDSLFVDGIRFGMSKRHDPLSFEVYELFFKNSEYLVLLSKARSASGTGNQITFYSMIKMLDGKATTLHSFESRFGTIENIYDTNKDGQLDFLKITNNSAKSNRYDVKLYDLKTDKEASSFKKVIVEYHLNDLFTVESSDWYFDLECKP